MYLFERSNTLILLQYVKYGKALNKVGDNFYPVVYTEVGVLAPVKLCQNFCVHQRMMRCTGGRVGNEKQFLGRGTDCLSIYHPDSPHTYISFLWFLPGIPVVYQV